MQLITTVIPAVLPAAAHPDQLYCLPSCITNGCTRSSSQLLLQLFSQLLHTQLCLTVYQAAHQMAAHAAHLNYSSRCSPSCCTRSSCQLLYQLFSQLVHTQLCLPSCFFSWFQYPCTYFSYRHTATPNGVTSCSKTAYPSCLLSCFQAASHLSINNLCIHNWSTLSFPAVSFVAKSSILQMKHYPYECMESLTAERIYMQESYNMYQKVSHLIPFFLVWPLIISQCNIYIFILLLYVHYMNTLDS
jgi:hypothetical protein